jgi:glycosyltransferase involved in cell wall biosynthesis
MNPPHFDRAPAGQPLLTVLVPVFNERPTVERLLQRLLDGPYPDKEIIVVDDGSDDGTVAALEQWADHDNILVVHHPRNRGKGAAVRTGLAHAHGAITLIQDADLEYDPADWPRLVEPIRRGDAPVVYGSRYLHPANSLPWSKFRVAVCLLNLLVRLLYGRRLSDEATCYKAMPTALFRALDLRADRFELCAEITAKVCRLHLPLLEVPIAYRPRTALEGKKIGWRDAWSTLWTLLKWRFLPLPRRGIAAERSSLAPTVIRDTLRDTVAPL